MHKHNDCEHELEYCKVCNVVYCERCNSQWRKRNTYTYPTIWYDNNTIQPLTNACGHDRTAGVANNAENLTASESGNITLTTEPVECCPSV